MIAAVCVRAVTLVLLLTASAAASDPFGPSEPLEPPCAVGSRLERPSDKSDVRIRRARQRAIADVRRSVSDSEMWRFSMIAKAVIILSFTGLSVLFAPILLRRRYPGRLKQLFGWSAFAAVASVLSMLLFAGLLVLFQAVQAAFNQMANPALHITQAGFDAIQDRADEAQTTQVELIDGALRALQSGETNSVPAALLQNGVALRSDLRAFEDLAKALSWVEDVVGSLPIFFAVIVVCLFLLSMRRVWLQLAQFPGAALSGETTARGTLRPIGRALLAELLSTFVLIALFLGIACVAAILTMRSVGPAVDVVVGYVLFSGSCALSEPGVSTGLIYAGVGSAILFLLLAVAVTPVASVLYLSRMRRVLHGRLVEGRRDKDGWRGFGRATVAVLWALLVPLLLVHAIGWGAGGLLETPPGDGGSLLALGAAPPLVAVGFLGGFWLLRGAFAIRFLRRA